MTEPCGTYGAYQRHKRAGEPTDPACRQANRDYLREWRATHPGKRPLHSAAVAARARALTRLAELYPEDYRRLLRDERREAARTWLVPDAG